MAGRDAGSLSSFAVKSGRCGLESSTTSMARLERRKPVMKMAGSWSASWRTMSRCTVGVAVAVRAMIGLGRRAGRCWPRVR